MIDFACKRFDIEEIIKCGFGLTKSEFVLLKYFLNNCSKEFDSKTLSKKMEFDLTTIQKALKKFSELGLVKRSQRNLGSGGYVYVYTCISKKYVREKLKEIIFKWSKNAEKEVDFW